PEEYLTRFPESVPTVEHVRALVDTTVGAATAPAPRDEEPVPAALGRYRVVRPLGAGTFGVVYQGFDDELRRDVAIKVARRDRLTSPEAVRAFQAEARVLAGLDHPGIVPVFDVGHTAEGRWFVVSKFMPGGDLADLLRAGRPDHARAVAIAARVAEALHH